MSEYIGSRISLISKSDIKYVGTLHEINSETSTIALENVTSYGTEGRAANPASEQPGSDQIYEYIVFRGSDVKELSMVEAPKENQPPAMPNDPAIMGSTRPSQQQQQQPPRQQPPNQQPPQFHGQPGQQQPPYPPYGFPPGPPPPQFQQQARFQGPGGPHGFPGAPGAVPGYGFAPPPPGYGMPPYGPPPGQGFQGPPRPGAFSPNNQPMPIGPPGQQRPPHMQGPGQGPVGSGSKQGTPQPAPAQAPQAPNAQANNKPVEMSGTPVPANATPSSAPPPPVESKPSTAAATAPPQPPAQQTQQKPAKKPTDSRIALPLAPNASSKPAAPRQAATPSQTAPATVAQPSSYVDATHAATAAVAAAMAKLGPAGQQQQQQQQPQAGMNMDNLTQKVNQMRVQDAPGRGRGRGRGRGGPAGVRRESAHKPVEVPTEDYDFESANAKFNKQDLVKEQIASGEPIASPQNGDVPDPISNGHTETEDVVIPAKPGAEKGYDKKSSFFDNISSDLKDRQVAQGEMIDGRTMRRDERNKNVDTFGQGSVDNGYRGGFRGRGRGGRGFGRGGPRGGGGYAPRGGAFEPRGAPRGRGRGGAGEATVA